MFEPNPCPKNSPVWSRKAQNNSKIRSTFRVRIEGIIENGNCYCIRIDYDDNNEEVGEKGRKRRRRKRRKRRRTRRRRKRRYKVLEGSYSTWL